MLGSDLDQAVPLPPDCDGLPRDRSLTVASELQIEPTTART